MLIGLCAPEVTWPRPVSRRGAEEGGQPLGVGVNGLGCKEKKVKQTETPLKNRNLLKWAFGQWQ